MGAKASTVSWSTWRLLVSSGYLGALLCALLLYPSQYFMSLKALTSFCSLATSLSACFSVFALSAVPAPAHVEDVFTPEDDPFAVEQSLSTLGKLICNSSLLKSLGARSPSPAPSPPAPLELEQLLSQRRLCRLELHPELI